MTLNELYNQCDSIQCDSKIRMVNYTNGKVEFTGFVVDAAMLFGDYQIVEFTIIRFNIIRKQVSHLLVTFRKVGRYDII